MRNWRVRAGALTTIRRALAAQPRLIFAVEDQPELLIGHRRLTASGPSG
jgi:hypothetical protein